MYIKKLKELTTLHRVSYRNFGCCLANVHKKIKRTHNTVLTGDSQAQVVV